MWAVSVIKDYNDKHVGGYGDWFMPSFYELTAIWVNQAVIKGFLKKRYWSSTEISTQPIGILSSNWKMADAVDFSYSGAFYPYGDSANDSFWYKNHEFAVRPIRKF
jgi:hypothetical protein